jgi:hypothetical protein
MIALEDKAEQQYIEMVWRIFFQEKLRGVDINTHFPWIVTKNSDVWYVILREGLNVIGGLTVKEKIISLSKNNRMVIGLIGLVCIKPEFRGLKLTRKMLTFLIDESIIRNYDALTLWTNRHGIYSSHDFILRDNAAFGFVDMNNCIRLSHKIKANCSCLPKHLGLPPFALRGFIYSNEMSSIRIVEDNIGPILVDWNGHAQYALSLIEEVLPTTFRFNTYSNDELTHQINMHGGAVQLTNTNLQMWKVINKKYNLDEMVDKMHFNLLERI